ncbi:glycoside hydrolase family 65 protein [Marinobacter orientalis]|uniref:Glycoside hydrolase family 65 protein n=1 Tax=Marinobacter orientalis TaxID=1928859 RepID=A0A7Y0WSJ8_9GAMM|nr:glycosyl hydrolase family 65 protein [Marinobacter orientalis]NMT63897.1 glycoside hydrolase family 65 protein [Marinobacter orientalis]TGX49997.1 glycoside hydrolase family 65 protein [Marinobacter orientalis]
MNERSLSDWELVYHEWDPKEQPTREALLTLGNGHFATRGAVEESPAGGPHYPGTYLAGGFDRAESEIGGKIIENEDLVNWPNWLPLSFRCEGGEWFDLADVELLDYAHRLDLYRGVLHRRIHFRDRADREFELETRRIVHMDDPHIAAISWVLTPLNWSGAVEIRSAIDGRVTNNGVARYRDLNGRHLEVEETGHVGEEAVFLTARTLQSRIRMVQAVRTRVWMDDEPAALERRTQSEQNRISQSLSLVAEKNKPVRVEKVLSLYTSRDLAISEPAFEACEDIRHAADFEVLLEQHQQAWQRLWRRADLELTGEECTSAQPVLRLHLFHLLQTASMHSTRRDVSIPARGLHGEGYRGHIFWDELFTFPYFNLRLPALTQALLLYRYERLHWARRAAKEAGYKGAMFPWQSGSDGREESQVLHLNPESGRWIPDNSHTQRHVNAAIAYNVWQYFQATDDMEFLSFYGAEMLIEIAQFWASIATYNPDRERYEIRGVMGPDEFHTRYPDREELGLDNNAYTNVMAAWVLKTTCAMLDMLGEDRKAELLQLLDVSPEDLLRWQDISKRMFVPFQPSGLISQFEGWDSLEELDWDRLREKHGDIQRLDRILEAEDRDLNNYKATKQADVLMLFFLFSAEELSEIISGLGYDFDPARIPENVRYYLDRTSHGSSLSRVVHAWVLARTHRERSWDLFQEALASDLDDIQGGTTREGIHLGAMAGTVDLMQRCYTGIEMRDGILWLNPCLPKELKELSFCVHYRWHWLHIHLDHETMTVSFEKGWSCAARVGFGGEVYEMCAGDQKRFSLNGEKSS